MPHTVLQSPRLAPKGFSPPNSATDGEQALNSQPCGTKACNEGEKHDHIFVLICLGGVTFGRVLYEYFLKYFLLSCQVR